MPEKYNPLRVPIAILHARAYITSRRLEKWLPLVEAEPVHKEHKGVFVQNGTWHDIRPWAREQEYSVLHNVFDAWPYLRRTWILMDGIKTVACRGCGLVASNDESRNGHYTCYRDINVTIRQLIDDGVCVICSEPFVKTKVVMEFGGCPVCSDDCRDIWDIMNPDAFELYIKQLLKDGKIK